MDHQKADFRREDPRLHHLFPGTSEVAALMRRTDWSASALGDPPTWPKSLLTMLSMLLRSRYQMWLGWGSNLHFFYNDAYRPTLGTKHPASLGAPTRELWSEIWHDIGPRIQHVLDTGQATWDEALLLMLERNGYPEETYHTFSYSPVPNDDGGIGGMLSVVTEETERVISERRLALVRELSSRLAAAKTTSDVGRAIEAAWPVADRDLPFTLLYLFDAEGARATLTARTGISADHPAADAEFAIAQSEVWPLAHVLGGRGPLHIDLPAGHVWGAARGTVCLPGRFSRRSRIKDRTCPQVCSSAVSTLTGHAMTATGASCRCSLDRLRPAWRTCARMRPSASARKRWRRLTARKQSSSPTSATNSARR